MADNSPNSVQFAPWPNVVCQINHGKVLMHVITFSYTTGTPALIQTKCSAGITIADTAAGRITFGFPAGGTGAIGWVVAGVQGLATPGNTHFGLDSDLTNFATGALELNVFADDANDTADDADIVDCTLLVYVVKA